MDWITVAAQIVNFLVLIWLLKRFLYRPILDGIDAREAEIAARLSSAEDAESGARAAEAAYRAQLAEFESEMAERFEAAGRQTEEERNVMRSETSGLMDMQRADWRSQMSERRAEFAAELHAAGAGAILTLAGKALGDLADAELEERIIARLEARLDEFGDDLHAASGPAHEAIMVTSFPLSEPVRERFTKSFHDRVADVPLIFEIDKTQSPGASLRLGGARLGWTIDTYLDGLETILAERLASQTKKVGSTA